MRRTAWTSARKYAINTFDWSVIMLALVPDHQTQVHYIYSSLERLLKWSIPPFWVLVQHWWSWRGPPGGVASSACRWRSATAAAAPRSIPRWHQTTCGRGAGSPVAPRSPACASSSCVGTSARRRRGRGTSRVVRAEGNNNNNTGNQTATWWTSCKHSHSGSQSTDSTSSCSGELPEQSHMTSPSLSETDQTAQVTISPGCMSKRALTWNWLWVTLQLRFAETLFRTTKTDIFWCAHGTGHQLGAVIIGSTCVFKSGFVVQNESSAPVTVTKHSMLLFWWATVPGLNVQHMLVRKTWTKALHLPSIWTSYSKQLLLSLLPWLCIHSPATALGSYDRY